MMIIFKVFNCISSTKKVVNYIDILKLPLIFFAKLSTGKTVGRNKKKYDGAENVAHGYFVY